ncbi:MAG: C4-type zinc ribbon domain-containing protein [Acidimicrobiales bacterium]
MTGASERFTKLLQVQDHDTVIDQLVHRRATLPERAALRAAESQIASIGARRDEVGAVRNELGARQAALEEQIASSKTRSADIDRRMYSGQVTAARDLQAMAEEVKHLARHVTELEDKELEVMEELEPVDTELGAADSEIAKLEASAGVLGEDIAKKESDIDAELVRERATRTDLAAEVPADLLAIYEQLRKRLGGTGAARIVNGSCSGCHLHLPAVELDLAQKAAPDTIIYCDQCGRILVR